jgi:hypothetical protein
MALAYEDFWPQSAPARRTRGGLAWEPLPGVLERVNNWQAGKRVRIINVETLVLPVSKGETVKPGEGATLARWDEDQAWVQVVRVWHEPLPVVLPPVLPVEKAATEVPASPTEEPTRGVAGA